MRLTIQLLLVLVVSSLVGCASKPPEFSEVPGPSGGSGPSTTIVKPSDALVGTVVAFNAVGRFAILNFPPTRVPAIGQTMFLFRDGLKVGEVKVTGPQKDDNIVADVVNGEAKIGDQVLDR